MKLKFKENIVLTVVEETPSEYKVKIPLNDTTCWVSKEWVVETLEEGTKVFAWYKKYEGKVMGWYVCPNNDGTHKVRTNSSPCHIPVNYDFVEVMK